METFFKIKFNQKVQKRYCFIQKARRLVVCVSLFFCEKGGNMKKKWKVKFYLNGQYVGSKKVSENEKVMGSVYPILILGKRQFFKSLFVRTVVKVDKLLYKDEKKKILHVGTFLFEGIDYDD